MNPTESNPSDEPTADVNSGGATSKGAFASPDAATVEAQLRERPGTHVGAYRLMQLLGEGGFGSVFLAEQDKPVQRKVALKIIKLGMDTNQVVARFEQERQALAVLDHPNIAKVFDAGATETGRPYFVMELCTGEPIDVFCDRNHLGVAERLRLFSQVCAAIQHAHTKGLIHRDIKPSNVLVSSHDGKPSAKVIDFGVAKATSRKMTERTLFTEHQQMIGTPEYMSPEQAEGSLDIDTRTDIYSLGVLLYELLTGSTPLGGSELRSAAYAEIQRIIREVEPPRPSTRLDSNLATATKAAVCRNTQPASLSGILKRDLDWVVMKCLEKDRSRRYDSASTLIEELERYLANEPVLAGPPTVRYRLSKFVRRHRMGVAAGLMVTVALVAATGISAISAWVARDALAAERERTRQLEAVSEFQADQLAGLDPVSFGLTIRARLLENAGEQGEAVSEVLKGLNFTDVAQESLDEQVFQRSIGVIDERFADQPVVRARLLHTVAKTMLDLGLLEEAVEPLQRALSIRREALGDDDAQTLASLSTMGRLMRATGDVESAYRLHAEALERRTRTLGPLAEETLYSTNDLGYLLLKKGDLGGAETYLRTALDGRRTVLGPEHRSTLISMLNMGEWYLAKGDVKKAEEEFRLAADGSKRVLGAAHPSTLHATNNLGLAYAMQQKFEEAEECWRQCLAGYRTKLGSDHPSTLVAMHNLAKLFITTKQFEEGERLALEAEQRTRGRYLGTSRQLKEAVGLLVSLYTKWDEAEPGKGYGPKAEEWGRRALERGD